MIRIIIQRTQTGVRLESSLLKVLKALAEYLDMSLGVLDASHSHEMQEK